MANQTIPITLTAGPVPPGFQAANIDQLLAAVATYTKNAWGNKAGEVQPAEFKSARK